MAYSTANGAPVSAPPRATDLATIQYRCQKLRPGNSNTLSTISEVAKLTTTVTSTEGKASPNNAPSPARRTAPRRAVAGEPYSLGSQR